MIKFGQEAKDNIKEAMKERLDVSAENQEVSHEEEKDERDR